MAKTLGKLRHEQSLPQGELQRASLGDYFPPGNVRSGRTCSSEWNQVSLNSNELSSGVTAKAGLQKPTQGISPLQQGLPHVSCCARMGFIGVRGAGVCRAHACWCLCSSVPTHCLSPPDCITGLLNSASAPQEQLPVRCSLSEPQDGAGGIEELGVNTGLCLDVPVPSCNPQHLLCPHPSCAAPVATHRMTATIAPQEIPSIYGQTATVLPG